VAVHSDRAYLSTMPFDRAMVKLDFKMALYCIRRDCMLEAVCTHIPNLLHFIRSAYTETPFSASVISRFFLRRVCSRETPWVPCSSV